MKISRIRTVPSDRMSLVGQSRHFGPLPMTSGLPLSTDKVGSPRHVGFVPIRDSCTATIGRFTGSPQGHQTRPTGFANVVFREAGRRRPKVTTLLIEAPSACGRQQLRDLRQARFERLPVTFNNRFFFGSGFLLGSDKHRCKSVESRAVQPLQDIRFFSTLLYFESWPEAF
jgi:hypothetical protein